MAQKQSSALRILLAALRQGYAVRIPGNGTGQAVTLTAETRAELVRDLETATRDESDQE